MRKLVFYAYWKIDWFLVLIIFVTIKGFITKNNIIKTKRLSRVHSTHHLENQCSHFHYFSFPRLTPNNLLVILSFSLLMWANATNQQAAVANFLTRIQNSLGGLLIFCVPVNAFKGPLRNVKKVMSLLCVIKFSLYDKLSHIFHSNCYLWIIGL